MNCDNWSLAVLESSTITVVLPVKTGGPGG